MSLPTEESTRTELVNLILLRRTFIRPEVVRAADRAIKLMCAYMATDDVAKRAILHGEAGLLLQELVSIIEREE